MTKTRAPVSIDAALARIAGQLPNGHEEMAQLVDRKARTVRNWGDPDTKEKVDIESAIKLDLAFQAAGGNGAPIFETYALKLELAAADRFSDSLALARLAPDVIRECGEANAAMIEACHPSATPQIRQKALKEVDDAVSHLKGIMPLLQEPPVQPP